MMGLWLLATLVASATQVSAIETETLATSARPIAREGQNIGCGIGFHALLRDRRSHEIRYMGLAGNITFFSLPDRKGGISLKLITSDANGSGGRSELSPFAIISASLVGQRGETNAAALSRRLPDPKPGTAILVFDYDGSEAGLIGRIARQDQLEIRFVRESGGAEVAAIIDLGVESKEGSRIKRSGATAREFLGCTQALIERSASSTQP